MNKLLSIIHYTFIESIRNRIFYVLVLFGFILVGAALLMSALGGEQPQRILLDLGLNAIEFFALLTIGFSAVTLVLEEMESKTIYLILTRPVGRTTYLTGRYLGLLAAVYCGMAIMACAHLGLLMINGWAFSGRYFIAVALSAGKITVIGSLAVFFSLFSTSAVSSISFTVFLWVLGHFSEEMRFLAIKVPGVIVKTVVLVAYYLVPNLQLFNLRDFWGIPAVSSVWLCGAAVYGLLYSILALALSLLIFRKREF